MPSKKLISASFPFISESGLGTTRQSEGKSRVFQRGHTLRCGEMRLDNWLGAKIAGVDAKVCFSEASRRSDFKSCCRFCNRFRKRCSTAIKFGFGRSHCGRSYHKLMSTYTLCILCFSVTLITKVRLLVRRMHVNTVYVVCMIM